MNKRIIFLFIASIIVFVIIILGINILIKKYTTETMIYEGTSQIKKQGSSIDAETEKKKALGPQEEPEREAPLQSKEPLLN